MEAKREGDTVDRAPLSEQPQARHALAERGAMEGVLSRVQKAFNDAFQVVPHGITLDTIPGDVDGWDSMGHLTLVNSLECEFHVSFDVDELMAMENVKEIVRIIEAKVAGKVT